MVSDTSVRSNTEIVREYVDRVFNKQHLDQAPAYLAPEVKWHGGTLGTTACVVARLQATRRRGYESAEAESQTASSAAERGRLTK
jgi:hypothetical protein